LDATAGAYPRMRPRLGLGKRHAFSIVQPRNLSTVTRGYTPRWRVTIHSRSTGLVTPSAPFCITCKYVIVVRTSPVTEQLRHRPDVVASLQQVRREAVPQRVRPHTLDDPRRTRRPRNRERQNNAPVVAGKPSSSMASTCLYRNTSALSA
jgi:hypothetical protein